MSGHTSILDTLPPGHDTHGQEGQHVNSRYSQDERQFEVGYAVSDLVHRQLFLEMGLDLAIAIASDIGVVCVQNPPDHMCVSYRSCFLLGGNVGS